MGALKLQVWTMQEWTNMEEVAGVDNGGGKTQELDNDGVDFTGLI